MILSVAFVNENSILEKPLSSDTSVLYSIASGTVVHTNITLFESISTVPSSGMSNWGAGGLSNGLSYFSTGTSQLRSNRFPSRNNALFQCKFQPQACLASCRIVGKADLGWREVGSVRLAFGPRQIGVEYIGHP